MLTEWMDLFPECVQRVLARSSSDHSPLLLVTVWKIGPPFKFEIMWLHEKGFTDCVNEWCTSFAVKGWMGYQLDQKLKFLKKKMIEWRKEDFGNSAERMNRLLAEIQSYDGKEEDQINRKICQKQFRKLILQDEIRWKQRSRDS